MKKLTMLCVALAMFATLSLSAADDAKPKRAKQAIPADLLKKYDKNGDGKVDKKDNLSSDEMKSFRQELKKSRESAPAPAPAPAPAK